jgi:anti-anti-sigma factor
VARGDGGCLLHRGLAIGGRTAGVLDAASAGDAPIPMLETDVRLDWHDKETAVLSLVGEHDIGTVDLVHTVSRRAAKHARYFILDLSETTFIDSAMIAELVRLERACRKAGTHFQVVLGDDSNTWRVLDVAGLNNLFKPHSSMEAAVAALADEDRN